MWNGTELELMMKTCELELNWNRNKSTPKWVGSELELMPMKWHELELKTKTCKLTLNWNAKNLISKLFGLKWNWCHWIDINWHW